MKKMFLNINYLLMLAVLILFCGCVIVEGAGRLLDGSAFEEKTTAVYKALEKDGSASDIVLNFVKNKDETASIVISIAKYPMLKLRAKSPDEEGAFHFSSLEYLAGSTHGWNEFTLELIGEGKFDAENKILEITDLETVQITKGRIQRYDTRLTGNDALTALRNRRERIKAVTNWMILHEGPDFADVKAFTNYWEPLFFPETVSAKKRPDGWIQEGDKRQKEDGIKWNIGYTERLFPEDLQPVRNSGTLLRDWEEALPWIYMEYEWENILAILSDKIPFKEF